jgi:hypothetical protein
MVGGTEEPVGEGDKAFKGVLFAGAPTDGFNIGRGGGIFSSESEEPEVSLSTGGLGRVHLPRSNSGIAFLASSVSFCTEFSVSIDPFTQFGRLPSDARKYEGRDFLYNPLELLKNANLPPATLYFPSATE